MTNSPKSNTEIVGKGYLWVNIPVIIIILIIWLGLVIMIELNYFMSIIIATIAGWYYWEFSIKKWVKWALENNVSPERLLKIGRIALLLSKKSTIENVIQNEKK